jgi:hypothetical protein
MMHPQVAERGDGLQMWRVAANILNKHLRTANRGGPPASGLGEGQTTLPHRKTLYLLQSMYKGLRNGRILWHEPSTGMDMRFGKRNVRSLYRAGSLKTVARELGKYKLDLVGLQEVR